MTTSSITNIVVAGLGGQGVLKASDILSNAAFSSGFDIKKAEVHGMSQRGGSVASDVRFGTDVLSPMIPDGAADILLVLEETQVEVNRYRLAESGLLLHAGQIDRTSLPSPKSLNVAMLGLLSAHLDAIPEAELRAAICAALPEKVHAMNMTAFDIGRAAAGE